MSLKSSSSGRWQWLVLGFIFIVVYVILFDSKVDLGGDNAYYYILGNALAQFEGYVNLQSVSQSPHNHFPPGYPFILGVFIKLFSDNIIFLKVVNGMFFMGCLGFTYLLVQRLSSAKYLAILVVIFLILNAHLQRYGSIMMSELPYAFFLIGTIYLYFSKEQKGPLLKDKWFFIILAMMMMTFYIRTTGVALILAVWVACLLERKWTYFLGYFIGAIVIALPWQIRSASLGGSRYVDQLFMINPYRPELGKAGFSDFLSRFWENTTRYITVEIPDSLFPFYSENYQDTAVSSWIWGIILIAIGIYGLIQLKREGRFIVIYLAATFGILLVWPSVWIGIRFILPSVPILMVALLVGVAALFSKAGNLAKGKEISPLWMLILVPFFIPNLSELHESSKAPYPAAYKNYFSLAKWVRREAPEAVVSCRKPALFYLYSKAYTQRYLYTEDDKALLSNLEEGEVDLVVLEQLGYSSTYRYLYPAVQKNKSKFKVVRALKDPDTYLLEFNP